MADFVADALHNFYNKATTLFEIVGETKNLETNIQKLLELETPLQLIKDADRDKIEKKLKNAAVIGVIGERNCGKSSLINALLDCKVVPQSSMTCTSRIVQIKYSENPYMCLLDSSGEEEKSSLTSISGDSKESNRILKGLVVLKGDDRHDEDLVSQVVEIGLKHNLLQYGAEIVDSPGRNENKTLDKVVDGFVSQKAIPVLIYVIDGKMYLRPADRATIQYYKEHCPSTQLLYVCSKVDMDMKAKAMDDPSDDEDDEEDGKPSEPIIDKGAQVLKQLQEYRLLDDQSSRETYHALSVKEAKKDKPGTDNHFVKDFQTFQQSLGSCLKKCLNDSLLDAVQTLTNCHANWLYVFNIKQGDIGKEEEEMEEALQTARRLEKKLFSKLVEVLDSKKQNVKTFIDTALHDVSKDLKGGSEKMEIQEVFAYNGYLSSSDVLQKYGSKLPRDKEFYRLHALAYEVRNYIINTMMSKVQNGVSDFLDDVAGDVWPIVIETLEVLDNPILQKNLQSVYQFTGSNTDHREQTYKSLTRLVNSMLTAVKEAITNKLHKTYGVLVMVETSLQVHKKMRKKEEQWQNQLTTDLLSKLNASKLMTSIVTVCMNKMEENHSLFAVSLREMDILKNQLQEQRREHLGTVQSTIRYQLAALDVRNRAIEYEITKGLVTVGDQLYDGVGNVHRIEHADHQWELQHPEQYVVTVVEKKDTSWERMLCSLHYASLCKQSEHLLQIKGWIMQQSDVLHIVTEKWDSTLDKSGMCGMTHQDQEIQIALDVTMGIQDMHQSGFIYNNLEVENILLMPNGRAKINTCRGKFEVLREKAANVDIHQIGGLLLWFHGARSDQISPESTFRVNRPHTCNARIWKLIEKCMAKHKTITISDIIRELQSIIRA